MTKLALVVLACAVAATAAQKCYETGGWTTLARSGKQYGAHRWGVQVTKFGERAVAEVVPSNASLPEYKRTELGFSTGPAEVAAAKLPKDTMMTAAYSVSPDMPTWHNVGGKTYIVNHFEFLQPATMYISEIASDKDGKLKMVSTRPVEDEGVAGMWFTCGGTKTPWNTHLGSEEYPPDCRAYDEYFVPCKAGTKEAIDTMCGLGETFDGQGLTEMARYFGFYNGASEYGLKSVDITASPDAHARFVKEFKCYNYGATPEVKVLEGGKTTLKKWRTLGRISHESALVMPNKKTVYTTDDNPNGVILKFEADKPADLSAGTLYAAKLSNQRNESDLPTWDVTWIRLGYGKQDELDKLATTGLKFSDMFEIAKPTEGEKGPTCPAGFKATNTPNDLYMHTDSKNATYLIECLKVKKGMETAAAFFESRRYASMSGASTEFEKKEGITYGSRFNQLYFTTARVGKGMEDAGSKGKFDAAVSNDIRLEANSCGAIWAVDLDENFSATKAQVVMQGNSKSGTDEENKCDINDISEPDNVHYVAGNLIINEDSSRHLNNVAWAIDLEKGTKTRIMSAPRLAEITGIWASPIGERTYLSMAIQHPGEGDGVAVSYSEKDVEYQRGYMGAIGPIPTSIMNDNYVITFDEVPFAMGAKKDEVYASPKVCARAADPKVKAPKWPKRV